VKIALVHDYLKEYGGAERVLRVLCDMYPRAKIYTAFSIRGSTAEKNFRDREIVESRWGMLIKYGRLYSPLRFLIPLIWSSLDLSDYDLVITSCSSYFARGFKVSKKTKVIAYCHTPPKFLYGYQTSIDWQRYWLVRVYAAVVNHFLRRFDYFASRRVDFWIANSKNVKERIFKHYRRDATIVYPPVEVRRIIKASEGVRKENFFFIAARLIGGKGIEEAVNVCDNLGIPLKIAGETAGWAANLVEKLGEHAGTHTEMLGRVDDDSLYQLYARAKGFFALEKEVDFGMTPVEAMSAGTPVIALHGGGFMESVMDGFSGIFVDQTDEDSLRKAILQFNKVKWSRKEIQKSVLRFDRKAFEKRIRMIVKKVCALETYA